MDKVTQSTAAQSEETAAAAQELTAQSAHLQQIAQQLFGLVQGSGTPGQPAPGASSVPTAGDPAPVPASELAGVA
jgi:methyl-accepting chemotaxis protein